MLHGDCRDAVRGRGQAQVDQGGLDNSDDFTPIEPEALNESLPVPPIHPQERWWIGTNGLGRILDDFPFVPFTLVSGADLRRLAQSRCVETFREVPSGACFGGIPVSQPRPKTTAVLVLSRTQLGQEEPTAVQG